LLLEWFRMELQQNVDMILKNDKIPSLFTVRYFIYLHSGKGTRWLVLAIVRTYV
jgi:hypothetical protein